MRIFYIIIGCLFLSSCSYMEKLTSGPKKQDTRITLAPGQHMDFSIIGRRNAQGQSMDEYKCPDGHLMVCAGNASYDCYCIRR